MLNIFEHLRSLKVDFTNEELFSFESADFLDKNDYCSLSLYDGSPAVSIVDGNSSTAFANKGTTDPSLQYVIIDFKSRKVSIRNYTLTTICVQPVRFFLLGSNDKQHWITLSNVTSIQPFASNRFNIHNTNHFRYLKLTQTKNSAGEYRLVIHHFEIYGSFGITQICSKQLIVHTHLSLFCILFFYEPS